MKKFNVLILFICSLTFLFGQSERYLIYFDDKGITLEEVKKDNLFYEDLLGKLSESAKQRRAKLFGEENILTEKDIPVNEDYISVLENSGIKINNKLNWFNAVSADLTYEELEQLSRFTFIKSISRTKKNKTYNSCTD